MVRNLKSVQPIWNTKVPYLKKIHITGEKLKGTFQKTSWWNCREVLLLWEQTIRLFQKMENLPLAQLFFPHLQLTDMKLVWESFESLYWQLVLSQRLLETITFFLISENPWLKSKSELGGISKKSWQENPDDSLGHFFFGVQFLIKLYLEWGEFAFKMIYYYFQNEKNLKQLLAVAPESIKERKSCSSCCVWNRKVAGSNSTGRQPSLAA